MLFGHLRVHLFIKPIILYCLLCDKDMPKLLEGLK